MRPATTSSWICRRPSSTPQTRHLSNPQHLRILKQGAAAWNAYVCQVGSQGGRAKLDQYGWYLLLV